MADGVENCMRTWRMGSITHGQDRCTKQVRRCSKCSAAPAETSWRKRFQKGDGDTNGDAAHGRRRWDMGF